MKISPLSPYLEVSNDTMIEGKFTKKTKFQYFFVENYNYNDSSVEKQIFDYAFKHLDSNYKEYGQYEIHFFKKTDVLNEKFIDNEIEELAWHYNNDVLYEFLWLSGEFMYANKYYDGKCINCK